MRFGLTAFILALALASGAGTAMAQSLSYECDLSGNVPPGGGMAGCSNGNPIPAIGTNVAAVPVAGNLSMPPSCTSSIMCGARSDGGTVSTPSLAVLPISAWGDCAWVDNRNGNSIFIPFRTQNEWNSFKSALPSGITLVPCTWPGTGGTTAFGPPYPGSNTQTATPPTVYGRADSTVGFIPPALPVSNSTSYWPTTPAPSALTWTSYGGATTITALAQWHGGCGMSVCGAALNTNWVPTFVFSPNLTLTAQDTTLGTAAGTSITATTGDTIQLVYKGSDDYGTITGVTAGGSSPGGSSLSWTPSGTTSGTSISGTNSGTLTVGSTPGTYTYTLTTADSNGLTSTATVTISTLAPAQCGIDNGGLFTAVSTLASGLCQSPDTASPALLNTAAGINGWSWTCTTGDGNTSNCNALQTAPQCGSVTINPDNTITNGPLCIVGTPTVTPTYSSQNYACTTTYGTATATTDICGEGTYIPPTVTDGLTASAAFIASGSTSQLNWSETNATGCSINGNSLSLSGVNSGTMTTGALTSTTSYTLSCTDGGAPVTSVATVNVCAAGTMPNSGGTACVAIPAPTVTLTAQDTTTSGPASTSITINSGDTVQLAWTVSGTATSCTASGGTFTGSVSTTSGSTQVVNPTSTTTYSLYCSNAGGNSPPQTATVTVNPPSVCGVPYTTLYAGLVKEVDFPSASPPAPSTYDLNGSPISSTTYNCLCGCPSGFNTGPTSYSSSVNNSFTQFTCTNISSSSNYYICLDKCTACVD